MHKGVAFWLPGSRPFLLLVSGSLLLLLRMSDICSARVAVMHVVITLDHITAAR